MLQRFKDDGGRSITAADGHRFSAQLHMNQTAAIDQRPSPSRAGLID